MFPSLFLFLFEWELLTLSWEGKKATMSFLSSSFISVSY